MGRDVELVNDDWAFAAAELPVNSSWDDVREAGATISLPHTWNAIDGQDGGNDYRRGRSTYARRLPAQPADGETWLEFRGVNSAAEVHVNGVHVGSHQGGYSTFRVDITDALGPENVVLVIVDNSRNTFAYPQRADFTFYGGIYRDVHLIRVARTHFALDHDGGPGVTATPELLGTDAHVRLQADLTGGDEVRFSIDGVASRTVPVRDAVAEASITIPDVRRWHGLRDPHLYELAAELLLDGDVVDRVELRFGCREFEVDPARGFILNGEEYPLRGVSRHQDWEGVGNAITPEMMETDMALLRELGATTVRLAHYQHDQHFYDLCDEAGIVVWAEIPQITEFLPEGKADATSQLTELIVQNRHHASIVCWGLSNEITVTGNGPEVLAAHRELDELAHRLDPTRLTTMAHLFLLETDDPLVGVPDVMSYNLYFGWYVGEVADNDTWLDDFHAAHPGTAIGLAEYGADANLRLQAAEPVRGDYSEQYQAGYHEHMLEMIEARPWLWATHVWNLADFGSDGRDEGGVAGRNLKGLVSFDRTQRKDAFHLYKAAWSNEPFVHVCGRRRVDRAEAVTEVTVYSNQPEVSLLCDGEPVATTAGRLVFHFEVPLSDEHEIRAVAGEQSDSIRVRRVAEPDPDQSLQAAQVVNWFDAEELPSPEGYFSVRDRLSDIKASEQGAAIIDRLMRAAAASRGDVAQNVEIPAAMQAIVDRMTVETLLRQAGAALPAEQIAQLNASLNQIAK
ncbi:glycoside hydrolase family 2 protein [Tessaracoccus rhinocerotis]|uniref:Glycoside hydrolase family 2 protein n=2 Tax=Tessaracoccus rhinocerotis TaxID=1689449 RepID=A0A553JWC8_9ACTN|nr:glycoside hydrolase family 2 protein [Tessaracoccus rhinocerotis]